MSTRRRLYSFQIVKWKPDTNTFFVFILLVRTSNTSTTRSKINLIYSLCKRMECKMRPDRFDGDEVQIKSQHTQTHRFVEQMVINYPV